MNTMISSGYMACKMRWEMDKSIIKNHRIIIARGLNHGLS